MSDYPIFEAALKAIGLPPPETEYQFARDIKRRWRVDYAWPEFGLSVEVEGGAWKVGGGRHTRGKGFVADMEKYNDLAIRGYCLLRFTPQDLHGKAIREIERWLKANHPDWASSHRGA